MRKKERFMIIDGSSLLYRAFFALPLLQTKQGLYTNAVYGFTTMLLKILEEEQPDYMAIAFDKSKKTFRHEIYGGYKARREKTPQELSEQHSYVRELLAALRIPVVEAEGYEADDVIGTLALKSRESGLSPVIVTGDADIFQLVDIPADVIYTKRGISSVERYNEEKLRDKYGLTARQYIDYKGLKGDPSDNIPGVPGIGEKTALKLLGTYGSMDGIYEHLDELTGKLRANLEEYREQVYLSRQLATICTTAPLEFNSADFLLREPDSLALIDLFDKLEFASLKEKIPRRGRAESAAGREDYCLIAAAELPEYTASLQDALLAVLPLPVDEGQRELGGLVLVASDKTYYVDLKRESDQGKVVRSLFDRRELTVFYDTKKWLNLCLWLTGEEFGSSYFDVALAAYLLDPLGSGYPLSKLSQLYLKRQLPEKPGKNEQKPDLERDYYCAAARALYDLYPVLQQKMQESGLLELYREIELPLVKVLSRMEYTGVCVDRPALQDLHTEFAGRINVLEEKIYKLAGEKFNLNSPKQLSYILFEKLGLPVIRKTKTGYSTDAKVLEELAPSHEIVSDILQYRTLIKLLGTYLEGLEKLINPRTGRIHTTFHQTVTATGRLSSAEPNLQNIPVRLEEGRRIRRAFIPSCKNRLLLSADYSQIELRIMAHFSADKVLIDSFLNNEDIHSRTAAEIFGVPPEMVGSELRNRAKAVNFGIIYGISDYGLSRQLGITRKEARSYIDLYFKRLPGVKNYMEEIIARAKGQGFVTTILNRRRYLPDINSRNFNRRAFAERTAINTPIQGSAADIIKLTMLRIEEKLQVYGDRAKMILQVHDDLIFDVEKEILPELAAMVRKEMEGAMKLKVPLTVDVKAGPNWAEMERV